MKTFTEKEAEDFLEKKKFKIVKRVTIKKKEELSLISKKIKGLNFPWVMKASSKKIVHKLKEGAVILNITNLKEAEKAFDKLSKIKGFEECLIQEMIKGYEFIIGLQNTEEFGRVIMLGKGGSKVEQEKDVSFRKVPITEEDAQQMLDELKSKEEIIKSRINIIEVKKNLIKVSNLTKDNKNITELDINPLIVNEQAWVVDARISFSK